MSAADNLHQRQFKMEKDPGSNPDQLRLFYRPSELINHINTFGDYPSLIPTDYDTSYLHQRNYTEAVRDGLAHNIRTEGIKGPLIVSDDAGNLTLENGHHRFAVAREIEKHIDPNFVVPVIHTDPRTSWFANDFGENTEHGFNTEWGMFKYDKDDDLPDIKSVLNSTPSPSKRIPKPYVIEEDPPSRDFDKKSKR